jgi:polysaccharide chain length determinant protein (PEP-CTERM system associated)
MDTGGSRAGLERALAAWGRRKWLATLVGTAAAAAGVTTVMSLPNVYRATATVLVEQPRGDLAAAGELDTRLQLINQEILSRSRLEALIQTHGLYPRLRGQASPEALAARMRRDIRTEFKSLPQANGPGSTIGFTLAYRGPDPRAVAQVANALASFYVEQDAKIRQRQTAGAVTVLDAQLEQMKRDLLAQERALAEFQEQHRGELPQHADLNLAALERLHGDLRAASAQKARALDRRDALLERLADEDAGRVAPADPGLARRARLQQELGDLRQRFSEKHPDVIQKRAELAALGLPEEEAAAAAPAGRADRRVREAAADLDEEIRSYRAEEARLRGQIDAYAQRLENAPLRQRGLQEITRDYQATRDLYDALRKRYEQAHLESGLSAEQAGPRFRVVDPAVVPSDPVAPNRMVLLLLALGGAAALGLLAAAAAETLDGSFHTADDLSAFTRVPVLASIPLIVTAGDRRRSRLRVALAAAALFLTVAGLVHAAHRVARGQEALVAMLARS